MADVLLMVRVVTWLLKEACFFCAVSTEFWRDEWRALLSELSSSDEPPTWKIFFLGGMRLASSRLWHWSLDEYEALSANLGCCFLACTGRWAPDTGVSYLIQPVS